MSDTSTTTRESLIDLHDAALDAALARRFVTTTEDVSVGEHTWTLLKPSNADHLISEADYVMDERLPYWADLWPSARVLASTIVREQGANRRLLELGCGLGLSTIAALHAGFDVTATDYYDEALHVTRSNAKRNLGREPYVQLVNWRLWPVHIGQFDVIMASDVLYEKEYAFLVAECIARALTPAGMAFVADPGRLALPQFREHIESLGLVFGTSTVERYEAGMIKQEIQVMRLAWR